MSDIPMGDPRRLDIDEMYVDAKAQRALIDIVEPDIVQRHGHLV